MKNFVCKQLDKYVEKYVNSLLFWGHNYEIIMLYSEKYIFRTFHDYIENCISPKIKIA